MSVYDCDPKDAMVGDFEYNCCNVVEDCQENILHEKDCPKEHLHSCYTCGMKGAFVPYSSNGRDCIPCQEKEYDLMIERKHHGEGE